LSADKSSPPGAAGGTILFEAVAFRSQVAWLKDSEGSILGIAQVL
jgi:hypothetical protein